MGAVESPAGGNGGARKESTAKSSTSEELAEAATIPRGATHWQGVPLADLGRMLSAPLPTSHRLRMGILDDAAKRGVSMEEAVATCKRRLDGAPERERQRLDRMRASRAAGGGARAAGGAGGGGRYRPRTFQERVNEETERLRAHNEAKRILAAEDADLMGVTMPEPVVLTSMLAKPDRETMYRVNGLWPAGGRIVLAAQYKAGKTTMVQNLARALADGHTFLGHPTDGPRKVAIIDTEMDDDMLRRQFRSQGIGNTDNVTVVPMRGAAAHFDLTNPLIRAKWVAMLAGSDVVILDPLRPVLDGIGLDEDKDVGQFLRAFDALLKELTPEDAETAVEGVIVHHNGHSGDRARGSSVILDWPDANWRLIRQDKEDPRSERTFSAYGRGVDKGEALVTIDSRGHLDLSDESPAGRRREAAEVAVMDYLATLTEPEAKSSVVDNIMKRTSKPRHTVRDAVNAAIEAGRVKVTTQGRGQYLSLPDEDDEDAAKEAEETLFHRPSGGQK